MLFLKPQRELELVAHAGPRDIVNVGKKFGRRGFDELKPVQNCLKKGAVLFVVQLLEKFLQLISFQTFDTLLRRLLSGSGRSAAALAPFY